jgi:hypothetical protein
VSKERLDHRVSKALLEPPERKVFKAFKVQPAQQESKEKLVLQEQLERKAFKESRA